MTTQRSIQPFATNQPLNEYPVLIPYQIDFTALTTGKHVSSTKRRVRFQLGFAHIPSLFSGKSGVQCRGLELEISFIWSVASGKHVVSFNGQQVHTSAKTSYGAGGKFEYSLAIPQHILPGQHILRLTALSSVPLLSNSVKVRSDGKVFLDSNGEVSRQYDLFLDGQSFFHFCKIFELEIGNDKLTRQYGSALDGVRRQVLEGLEKGNYSVDLLNRSGGTALLAPVAEGEEHNDADSNNVASIIKGRARYSPGSNRMAHKEEEAKYSSLFPHSPNEERKMMALARTESLRDSDKKPFNKLMLRKDLKEVLPVSPDQERKMIAEARLASLRDLRITNETPPAKSVPVASTNKTAGSLSLNKEAVHRQNSGFSFAESSDLKSPTADHDFIDLKSATPSKRVESFHFRPTPHDYSQGPPELVRSTSSFTNDNHLDDDVSVSYSHLDPRQTWKTQRNVSFTLQSKAPVYADGTMKDLAPMNESFGVNGGSGNAPSKSMQLRESAIYAPPTDTVNPHFGAPPPPTWEEYNNTFPYQSSRSSISSVASFASSGATSSRHHYQQRPSLAAFDPNSPMPTKLAPTQPGSSFKAPDDSAGSMPYRDHAIQKSWSSHNIFSPQQQQPSQPQAYNAYSQANTSSSVQGNWGSPLERRQSATEMQRAL